MTVCPPAWQVTDHNEHVTLSDNQYEIPLWECFRGLGPYRETKWIRMSWEKEL